MSIESVIDTILAAAQAVILELVPGSTLPLAAAQGILSAVEAVIAAPSLTAEQVATLEATLPELQAAVNAHAARTEAELG